MGIDGICSTMNDLILNSPLKNSEKQVANHPARKTLQKSKLIVSPKI